MIYHVNIILMIIPVNRHVKDHGDCGNEVHVANIIIHITSCNINLCMFE